MVAGEGRGGRGEGMDWEFGISRCKLLYIEWINNKVLLSSTGNYIKYLVISHNGKEKNCKPFPNNQKNGKNPNIYQWINEQTKCDPSIQWHIIQP